MLEFYNIQLQANKHIFTKQLRKFIRFSQKNNLAKSKQPNAYINESTLSWDNPIKFNTVFGQDIDFQIYEKHEFGYNPEEMSKLLYGSIKINSGEKIVKFPVYSEADNHNKIGYLMVNIRKPLASPLQSAPNKPQEKQIIINSILVRKLAQKIEKGYVTIATNKDSFKTQTMEAISKQFLFLDKIDLGHLDDTEILHFQLHSQHGLAGKGKILFKTCKKSNRIDIFDKGGQFAGELYFQVSDPRATQHKQVVQALQPSRAKSTPNIFQQLRSMSDSHFSGQSQFLGTSRRKKVSVIHKNTDIFAPSEKRFMIYQDKQTDIISYSKLPDMKFQDPIIRKSYRGASFGKGEKTNFARPFRDNPGVGDYKLPSIFDRY